MLSIIINIRCQSTETTSIIVMLKIFDCRWIRMETSNIQFFDTANRNMKYDFIGVVFTSNVSLKQPVVKVFLSCLVIILKRFLLKSKPLLSFVLTDLQTKWCYLCFHFIFEDTSDFCDFIIINILFNDWSCSEIFVCLKIIIWENRPHSRPMFWIYLLKSHFM